MSTDHELWETSEQVKDRTGISRETLASWLRHGFLPLRKMRGPHGRLINIYWADEIDFIIEAGLRKRVEDASHDYQHLRSFGWKREDILDRLSHCYDLTTDSLAKYLDDDGSINCSHQPRTNSVSASINRAHLREKTSPRAGASAFAHAISKLGPEYETSLTSVTTTESSTNMSDLATEQARLMEENRKLRQELDSMRLDLRKALHDRDEIIRLTRTLPEQVVVPNAA